MVCLDCGNSDIRYVGNSYHCNNCGSRNLGNNFNYSIDDYVFDKVENRIRHARNEDNRNPNVEYIGRFSSLDDAISCYKNMNI